MERVGKVLVLDSGCMWRYCRGIGACRSFYHEFSGKAVPFFLRVGERGVCRACGVDVLLGVEEAAAVAIQDIQQ